MQRDLKCIIAETSAMAIRVTAQPGTQECWIRYSDSNDGEPDYYRDYLDPRTGEVLYSLGESCSVHPWVCNAGSTLPLDFHGMVLLSNENCDAHCFAVPLTQFETDFGSMADVVMQMLTKKQDDCSLRLCLETDDLDYNWLDALDVELDVETGAVGLDCAFAHDGMDSLPAWRFCNESGIGMNIEVQNFDNGYSSFFARTTVEGLKKFLSQHRVIPALVKKDSD